MMESVDAVQKPPEIVTSEVDESDAVKIMDDKGDRPPAKPLTPMRSYVPEISLENSEQDAIPAVFPVIEEPSHSLSVPPSIETVENANVAQKPAANIFSFGKLTSALPVGYLNYFTTKPAANATTANVSDETENSNTDIEGGTISEDNDGTPPTTHPTNSRTWAEWASEKSVGTTAADYMQMLQESTAVEIDVPARAICRAPFLVPKGSAIVWTVRVRLLDLGFAVRLRRQGLGGAVEDDIVPLRRIAAGESVIGGRAAVDYPRHIVFVFDNSYSTLRAKKCAHRVQVGPHIICEDESVLAGPDIMPSPFAGPVAGPVGASSGSQLEALSALLGRAQEAYTGVLKHAGAAGQASIGAVQGGLVVAVGAPLLIQRAIVASLRGKPVVTTKTDAEDGAEGTEAETVAVAVGGVECSADALLPVLDMDNFCALWVQLEEGAVDVTSTVIPRPAIEEGFPLQSLPQHLSTAGGVHVLASGDVTGGCKIFGYTTTSCGPSDNAETGSGTSFYVLVEVTVDWRGPSQESPGYDDWTLKATLRTPCPDKTVLKSVVDNLKLSDAFFIIV